MKNASLEILDFWAEWCGPCHVMKPIIEELEKEYAGKVTFTKIDVDTHQDIAGQYNILSIPTMIFKKGETVVDQIVGAVAKSELKKKIDEHLGV